MKTFEDRVAVVTGAASGIGRAIAFEAASRGMKVVLADIEEAPLAQAQQALQARGATTIAVRTDVARLEDVQALAQRAWDAYGGVHLLVNNAGVGLAGRIWECSDAEWQWIVGVNQWSVIHAIRTFVPRMIAQGAEAHVLNTASIAGLVAGGATHGAYAMTKHAVVAISESLHHELRQVEAPIGVSVLCPGWVRTRILESQRNRPVAAGPAPAPARAPTAAEAERRERVMRAVAEGMAPEQLATLVFEAIADGRFYIVPPPPPPWKEAIRMRFDDIMADRAPRLPVT